MINIRNINKSKREEWLKKTLSSIPADSRILDAGAGEQPYKKWCKHLNYVSQDFGRYDGRGNAIGLQTENWKQDNIDIISDIVSIPEPAASFDAIMCIEVLEHLPEPIEAIKEFSRLLKRGGQLILTSPFCSLTHFAPHYFYSGFSRYFYERYLPANGFEITDIHPNGNYFSYLAQELHRVPFAANKYADKRVGLFQKCLTWLLVIFLDRLSRGDKGSSDMLSFGFHVKAVKKR